jgi:hypothetical protein
MNKHGKSPEIRNKRDLPGSRFELLTVFRLQFSDKHGDQVFSAFTPKSDEMKQKHP